MSKPRKIAFHVSQLCTDLSLTEVTKSSLEVLIDMMIQTHQEYKFESKSDFQTEVEKAFKDHIDSQKYVVK
jgi:hypothetical protein